MFVVTQILKHSAVVKFIYTVFPLLPSVIFLTLVLIVDLYLREKSWDNIFPPMFGAEIHIWSIL